MSANADESVIPENVKRIVQSALLLHENAEETSTAVLEQMKARCIVHDKIYAGIKQLVVENNPKLSKPDRKVAKLAATAICVGYDETILDVPQVSEYFSNITANNGDVNYLHLMELIYGKIFSENISNPQITTIANNAYFLAKKKKKYYEVLKKTDILGVAPANKSESELQSMALEDLSERIRKYLKDIRKYPKCQRTMSAFEQFIKETQAHMAKNNSNAATAQLAKIDAPKIFGRLKTLMQFGPDDSIVARLDAPYLNESEFDKRFHPIEEFTDYPFTYDSTKDVLAIKRDNHGNLMSLVIKTKNDDGKFIVSKIMEESYYTEHANNRSFKDDDTQEVMIQRILCEEWESSPWKFSGPCPYIVALEGVTKGKPRDKKGRIKHGPCVITHMEPGDTPYIERMIDLYKNKHISAIQKWYKQILKRSQQDKNYQYSIHTSPWEEDRRSEFIQMLFAIFYMHKLEISHRDLKLDNCVIVNDPDTGEPIVKIIDFGVARRFDDLHNKRIYNDTVGTPGYQSPECYYSERTRRRPRDLKLPPDYTYSAEANDIFCLGATLYSMMTGTRTFEYPTNGDRMFRTMTSNTYNIGKRKHSEKLQQHLYDTIIMKRPRIRLAYMVTRNCVNLLERMLCPEDERITINEIFGHPWIQEGLQLRRNSEEGDYKLNFSLPLRRRIHEMPPLDIRNIKSFKKNEKAINQFIKGIRLRHLKANTPELITDEVITTLGENNFSPEESLRIYMNNLKIVPDKDLRLFLNKSAEEKGPENWTSMELEEKLEICRDLRKGSSVSSLYTLKEDHGFSEEEARAVICTRKVKTCPLFYVQLEPDEREELETEIKHFNYIEHEESMAEYLVEYLLENDQDLMVDTRKMKDLLAWLKEFKSVYACPKWYFILPEDIKQNVLEIITNLGDQTPLRVLIRAIAAGLQSMSQPVPTDGDILDFLNWIANLEEEREEN